MNSLGIPPVKNPTGITPSFLPVFFREFLQELLPILLRQYTHKCLDGFPQNFSKISFRKSFVEHSEHPNMYSEMFASVSTTLLKTPPGTTSTFFFSNIESGIPPRVSSKAYVMIFPQIPSDIFENFSCTVHIFYEYF